MSFESAVRAARQASDQLTQLRTQLAECHENEARRSRKSLAAAQAEFEEVAARVEELETKREGLRTRIDEAKAAASLKLVTIRSLTAEAAPPPSQRVATSTVRGAPEASLNDVPALLSTCVIC